MDLGGFLNTPPLSRIHGQRFQEISKYSTCLQIHYLISFNQSFYLPSNIGLFLFHEFSLLTAPPIYIPSQEYFASITIFTECPSLGVKLENYLLLLVLLVILQWVFQVLLLSSFLTPSIYNFKISCGYCFISCSGS